MASFDLNSLLESTPGVCGGQLRLAGSRITILRLATVFKQGYSAEDIVTEVYPHLDLAKVYAGLAYYIANRDLVETELKAEEVETDRLLQEHRASAVKSP